MTTSITEQLVTALSAAWRAIQQHHPEVPDVVLTLGSGTAGRTRSTKWGHFAESRWHQAPGTNEHAEPNQAVDAVDAVEATSAGEEHALHELFVGGEGLRRGADEVLATELHEAAHGLATARRIVDTSRQGRYHNARFKALAEELGLAVAESGGRGWSQTSLTPETRERYAETLQQLAAALTVYRADETPTRGIPGRGGQYLLALCECHPPRKIRVTATNLERAPILCGACEAPFAT